MQLFLLERPTGGINLLHVLDVDALGGLGDLFVELSLGGEVDGGHVLLCEDHALGVLGVEEVDHGLFKLILGGGANCIIVEGGL